MLDHDDLMKKIDSEVNSPSDRCVEYIFTKPKWSYFFKFLVNDSQSAMNPYGHSALRYVDPDTGEDTVMNVCGLKGKKLINFIPAHEYLFTDIFHEGNEQGGVFNRSFLGVRVENVDKEKIRELHKYFKELQVKQDKGEIRFFLLPFSFLNPIRRLLGRPMVGNCSHWTSLGLKHIGLLPRTYSWPLLLYFEMIRAQMATKFKSLNIVSYLGLTYPVEPEGSFIYPFYWLRRGYSQIWQLDDLSNVLVALDTSGKLYGDRAKFNKVARLVLQGRQKQAKDVIADIPDSSPADTKDDEASTEKKASKLIHNTVITEESIDVHSSADREVHQAIILKQRHIRDRFEEIKHKFKYIFRDD